MDINRDRTAVIIVNYNSGKYLKDCLSALRQQTQSPHRVVVVDNASQDGSLDDTGDLLSNSEVIRLESNRGFAEANNLAVDRVEDCGWVVLLNPDTLPEPDWLAELHKAARGHPEFSFFGCHMTDYDNSARLDGTGDVYHVSGLAWRRDHKCPVSQVQREDGEIFSPCAAAAMYQRKAFLEAGGFDESFFTYFEDLDLGFRLRLLGHRCRYVSGAKVAHKGWVSVGRTSDFYVYHAHRNLVWTYFKNMPGRLFWKYLPQHLFLNLVSLIRFTLKGSIRPIWQAKWDAFLALPEIKKKRAPLQRKIKIDPDKLEDLLASGWKTPFLGRYR